MKKALITGTLAAGRIACGLQDHLEPDRLIAEMGRPGEVYNVGSGVTWSAQEVLDMLRGMAR